MIRTIENEQGLRDELLVSCGGNGLGREFMEDDEKVVADRMAKEGKLVKRTWKREVYYVTA